MSSGKKIQGKLRILIVSVGSLVGQNILDALEFKEFNRRHLLHIIGTNSLVLSANNFRCDECYKVPLTASPDYPSAIKKILKTVQPDLILPARDADTVAMKKMMMEDNSLPGKLPLGSLESIIYALDKWQSYKFCSKHGLPFAETIGLNSGKPQSNIKDFSDRVGYPMIAKLREGYASKGVFFVRNWEELQFFRKREGYILQEYLGKASELNSYFETFKRPIPLFSEVPNVSHHTCHVPVFQNGEVGEVYCLKNHHQFGAVVRLQRVKNTELEELAVKFAESFISEGGYGPLSIQFRPDKDGVEKAQEMNLRTTGSTFPRLIMGQDEIGTMIQSLLPFVNFPVYERADAGYSTVITKSLYSYEISKDQLSSLDADGHWAS